MLKAFEAELTVTETAIVEDTVAVCVSGDEILGFCRLVVDGEEGEVADCFVSPCALRQGVGAALMTHLKDAARAAGVKRLEVQSDPYAEKFYLTMGYTRFSQSPSGSVPGRCLPLLEMMV
ncbi:MAG: GNAT family N-acetyltransferase [Alphaproteobacteria bacterium]|nr:GNAT family N-acetyltransferase [Alphaproteobacteria bacterium]